ncbi:lytic transglycosylase domain-containing protein [Microvirga massiliensis]|uniref:lytic transglycosylase domain-containing protein n=1 Tax=Microvirga massiliensis TaxID=1033741 RepID=UPI00069BB4C1|nr:lytic transglycosylase domain-containing protein [Microvirga massiliensis]
MSLRQGLGCLLASGALLASIGGTVAAADRGASDQRPFQVAILDVEAFPPLEVPEPPPLTDFDYLPRIFSLYRSGDIAEADILRSRLTEPASLALSEWFAIRTGARLGLDRLLAFQRDYPDWPSSRSLQRRIEEALLAARPSPERIRAHFATQPPLTTSGRVALAFALKSASEEEKATEIIRNVWREDLFGPELEGRILESFSEALRSSDHRFRMERLLFRENWSGALRAAERAGKDYPTLVRARMGIYQGKKKAEKAFAAVPSQLRTDSSYIFSRALYLKRQKKLVEAADVMAKAPQDPDLLVDGDRWWSERRYITRELLDEGDPKAAYQVASQHGAEGPAQRIEAEFHAGWIALRFLNNPADAKKHFAEAATIAGTPISVSRAAYWQARAAEAAGETEDAQKHYRRAAENGITFYGQLAREHLGMPLELRMPGHVDPEARTAFLARTPARAFALLHKIGEKDLAVSLAVELAQSLEGEAELETLASIADENLNPRAVLVIGKAAVQQGLPLDLHAYPVSGIPEFTPVGDVVEPAMVYAIARQESAFNPRAISSAGARGLMQLMPATAKRTAQRFGVGFDVQKLVEDAAYNAKIGAAHLGELMEDWRGSHVLAFASYNAGGGNVMKWVKAYGDPRKPEVDLVDWIERIPFHETRNYVQRVIENLNVYRARLDRAASSANAVIATDGKQEF